MALTAAQMARMRRLLDEVLGLDEAAKRAWLKRLSPADQDLADALRRALFSSGARDSSEQALATIPKSLSVNNVDACGYPPEADDRSGEHVERKV